MLPRDVTHDLFSKTPRVNLLNSIFTNTDWYLCYFLQLMKITLPHPCSNCCRMSSSGTVTGISYIMTSRMLSGQVGTKFVIILRSVLGLFTLFCFFCGFEPAGVMGVSFLISCFFFPLLSFCFGSLGGV